MKIGKVTDSLKQILYAKTIIRSTVTIPKIQLQLLQSVKQRELHDIRLQLDKGLMEEVYEYSCTHSLI